MEARVRRWPWLAITLVATAPVHLRTARRLAQGAGDAWGLLALLALVVLVAKNARAVEPERVSLWAPGVVLVIYAATYATVFPLVRSALAMLALSLLLAPLYLGRRFDLGLTGLCLLSLPVAASLQFYLGYPLRAFVARVAALILQASGLAVTAKGVGLSWGRALVVVDAPCAGIKMLWVGALLTSALVVVLRLSLARSLMAAVCALSLIVVGNALRAAALFYPEVGLLVVPEGAHEAAGLAVFAAIAIGIVVVCLRLDPNRAQPCATPAT
jgi:exosortase/archaeosortase family protein